MPFLVIQAIGKTSIVRETSIDLPEKARWRSGTGPQPRIAVHQAADFPSFVLKTIEPSPH